MRRRIHGVAAALIAIATVASAAPGDRRPVRYIDAHSHIIRSLSAEEEIARFRRAGLAGVVLMDADAAALTDFAQRAPGYVVPFVSVARTAQLPGLRLDADTAPAMDAIYARGAVCGFGEVPTRLDPNPEASDEAALTNRFRSAIYDLAEQNSAAVNIHTYAESPPVAAAVERIAATHPHMVLILAHAGWGADAATIGRLMRAHSNVYADLSVRLDPPAGLAGGEGSNISILAEDGALRPEWLALLLRFPDRFLFGLDVTGSERPKHITEMVASARKALSSLPRPVEEKVAHRNIEKLVRDCGLRFSSLD